MQKEIQNKKIGNKPGFSLIEVIISIFLIIIGLFASIELISKGLRESIDSRDQSIATELAQEGIELVRNVRDNNWLNFGPLDPQDGSFEYFDDGNCRIDKNSGYGGTIDCGVSGNEFRLYIDNDGFYVHDPGTATKFYRKLIIEDGGDTMGIVSMVVWSRTGNFPAKESCNTASKCAFTQTILTRWGEGSFNQ